MEKKTKTASETVDLKGTGVKAGSELAVVDRGDGATNATRVRVNKAYKMFVGGAFVRSESGRYFQANGGGTTPDPDVVNIPRGSRKDVRDAVLVAKNAADKWASRTAYNRGQILYRLAEVMESRSRELNESLMRAGVSAEDAAAEVVASIDRVVFYAGFCDKISSLLASHNPVSGPHFGFTIPEPMGVVAVITPRTPYLLGLVSTIIPIVCGGNVVVASVSEEDPRTAIVWAECLATSDVPGGVINLLTGYASEMGPILAKHREVLAIDATVEEPALAQELEKLAADSVKRAKTRPNLPSAQWFDDRRGQGLSWIERYIEMKTIWHPMGL